MLDPSILYLIMHEIQLVWIFWLVFMWLFGRFEFVVVYFLLNCSFSLTLKGFLAQPQHGVPSPQMLKGGEGKTRGKYRSDVTQGLHSPVLSWGRGRP